MTDEEKFMTSMGIGLIKTNYEYVLKEVYINNYDNCYYFIHNDFVIKFKYESQIKIKNNIRKLKIIKLLK